MKAILKQVVNKGTIIGSILFILFVFYYNLLGVNPFGFVHWLSISIQYFLLYIFAQQIVKLGEIPENGLYAYIFRILVLIVLVYSTFYGALTLIFGWLIDPGFLNLFIEDAIKSLQSIKEMFPTTTSLEVLVEDYNKLTLEGLVWNLVSTKIFSGVLVSFFYAWILKKNINKMRSAT